MRHSLQNRVRVLKAIVDRNARASRTEIAAQTGLSLTTLSRITSSLVSKGIIFESGGEESKKKRRVRGPRPRPLSVRSYLGYSIGVDVEGMAVRAVVIDFANCIHQKVKKDLPDQADSHQIADAVGHAIEDVAAMSHIPADRIVGIGMGLPGAACRPDSAEADWPYLGEGVCKRLEDRLGREICDAVSTEHNMRCFALAEQRLGKLAGCPAGAVLVSRYGVGVAFVRDGVAQVGETAPTGEIGHSVICDGGHRCRCGQRGCLEAYSAAWALNKQWRKRRGLKTTEDTMRGEGLRELLQGAADKDPVLLEVVREGAHSLGIAIGNLSNIYGARTIVVHGIYSLFGRTIHQVIEDTARQHIRHAYMDEVRVCFSELGEFAGSMGAALLARDKNFAVYVSDRVLNHTANDMSE